MFLVIVISLSITALIFPMLSMRALRFCNLLKAHFIHYNNKAHMYTIFSKRREMFNVRTWQWMDEKCFTYSYSRVFVLKFGGFLRGIMLFVLQPASASHASILCRYLCFLCDYNLCELCVAKEEIQTRKLSGEYFNSWL